MRIKTFIFLVGVIVLGIVFGSQFFVAKPNFLLGDVSEVFSSSVSDEVGDLQRQNDDLRNKLFTLQHDIAVRSGESLHAKVFSLYPFNTKNRVYIDRGAADGIQANAAVLVTERILFGQIARVDQGSSEVVTVFDPQFSLPVRIGDKEVDGLLKGGVYPRITLIDKTKQIDTGAIIISASKDHTFGYTVGSIKEVHEDPTGAFFEASISLPYNLNDVRTVSILQ